MEIVMNASIVIARPPEAVFDFVTRPEAVAETFKGHGPVPGANKSEVVTPGGMRVGAIRRVHNSDGSIVDEEIVALDRGIKQAYRLVKGLPWMFRGGGGTWTFSREGEATRIDWRFSFDLVSPLVWPIAVMVRAPFARAMQDALARTKSSLES
jgi:carbon monoxide dehydrogenase subunit G